MNQEYDDPLAAEVSAYQDSAAPKQKSGSGRALMGVRTSLAGKVLAFDNRTVPISILIEDQVTGKQQRAIMSEDFWLVRPAQGASHNLAQSGRAERGNDPYVLRGRQNPGETGFIEAGVDFVALQDCFQAEPGSKYGEGFPDGVWVARRITKLVGQDRGQIYTVPAMLQFLHRDLKAGRIEPIHRAGTARASVPFPSVALFPEESTFRVKSMRELRDGIISVVHEDPAQYMPNKESYIAPTGMTITLSFYARAHDGRMVPLPFDYNAGKADATNRNLTMLVGSSRTSHEHPCFNRGMYLNDGPKTWERLAVDTVFMNLAAKVFSSPDRYDGIVVVPGLSVSMGAASAQEMIGSTYGQMTIPAYVWPRQSGIRDFVPFGVPSIIQVAPTGPSEQFQVIKEIIPIYTHYDPKEDLKWRQVYRLPMTSFGGPWGAADLSKMALPRTDWMALDMNHAVDSRGLQRPIYKGSDLEMGPDMPRDAVQSARQAKNAETPPTQAVRTPEPPRSGASPGPSAPAASAPPTGAHTARRADEADSRPKASGSFPRPTRRA